MAILGSLIFLTARKFLTKKTFHINLDKGISVGDVPFPAITICPDSLVFEKVFEYQNKLLTGNFTDDELVFELISTTDYSFFVSSLAAYQVLDLLYDQNYLPFNFSTQSLLKTLEKFSQEDSFFNDNSVYWDSNRGAPFSRILTKWGLCFNFNLHLFTSLLDNKT